MAENLENKKDKSAFKAEKRAAIKAARDKAKAAAGKEVKVISAEEKIYRNAAALMGAVDCIERFERIYYTMNSAAKKFNKIQGYRDADEKRQECLEIADIAVKDGTVKVFNNAVLTLKEAKTKSDYADAIENFKRCKKFKYNMEKCDKYIAECNQGIAKLETKAAYKRRGIVVAVFVLLFIVFLKTPAFPMVKGMYHQSQGKYKLAIANYKESNGFLVASGNMKKCYYHIGLKKRGKRQIKISTYKL